MAHTPELCTCVWCCAQKFEEMLAKYDKDNKGGLTYKVRMLPSGKSVKLGVLLQPHCGAFLWHARSTTEAARQCHIVTTLSDNDAASLTALVPARLWSISLFVDDVVHLSQFAVGPTWPSKHVCWVCQWTSLKAQEGPTARRVVLQHSMPRPGKDLQQRQAACPASLGLSSCILAN